jgi:hypothetical protein
MRPLTIALLATCLLGASAVPAIAQDVSPPPWFGGRVEMPSEGIAVTIPDDWVAIDMGADVESQLARVGRSDVAPETSGAELLLLSPTGDACGLDLVKATAAELHDPEFLGQLEASLESNPDVSDYDEPSWLELPAGRAFAQRYRYRYPEEWGGQTIDRQAYWVAGDPYSVIITCDGIDPVATDRLSIAESFEWLRPADTAGMGGRFESVEAGVALTFPDDWVVLDLEEPDQEKPLAIVSETHPRWVQTMTMLLEQLRSLRLTSGDHFHALALAPATPQGYPASQCLVASSDVPVGHPIDEFSAEELAAIDQDPLLQSGPEISEISLPLGPSHRVDDTKGREGGLVMYESLFLLDTEAALTSEHPEVRLACSAFEGQTPEWSSIAETIEYLPAEE